MANPGAEIVLATQSAALEERLVQAEAAIAQEERATAAELLSNLDLEPATVDQLARLGAVAELAGELAVAASAYNGVLARDPDNTPALLSLGRLLADRGEAERAAQCFKRLLALRPEDAAAAFELAQLSESPLETPAGSAASPWPRLGTSGGTLTQATTLTAAPRSAGAAFDPSALPSPPEAPIAVPSDAHAVTLAERFAGREGVYARQWCSESGRTGYTPVREPFTPAVARHHLMGTFTVGIYPLRIDGTVRFLCFDIDLGREALRTTATSSRARAALFAQAQDVALRVQDTLASAGELPSYLEDSGQKGRHVWVFFERPVPAALVRRLARAVLAEVPLPAAITVEVFPRQSRLTPGMLGNLVKLPLGVHRGTGRRALFLDGGGRPLPDPLSRLLELRPVSPEAVAHALTLLEQRRETRGLPPATEGDEDDPPDSDPDIDPPSSRRGPRYCRPSAGTSASRGAELEDGFPSALSDALTDRDGLAATAGFGDSTLLQPDDPSGRSSMRTLVAAARAPYLPDEDLELQALLSGCAVLRELVTRVKSTGLIDNDERLVVTHTLGCLTRGAEAVNSVLDSVPGFDPSLRLTSPLRGSPTSCARIRARLPALTDELPCSCELTPHQGLYPTPLLHAAHARATSSLAGPADMQRLQIERLVREYLRARSELARLQRSVQDLGRSLRELMTEQHLDALTTDVGTLRPGPGALDLVLELGTP